MADINIRSDNVDVEQIMRQIRARIREKRGVDYTEEQIRELAAVKLEKFLDPRGVRSDLLDQFRRSRAALPPAPNFAFEDSTLFDSHRGALRWIRRLLRPILKLFFNPNPLIQALHIQSELNTRNAKREDLDGLHYEVMHNLVLELTRLGIEVKNLKMRVESMSSRLDFDERRARALEGVVMYRPGAAPPLQPPAGPEARPPTGGGDTPERRNRRRRRRGRRRPFDSRDQALAQGGPSDPREGPLAQGGPSGSHERPAAHQGNAGDRSDARPDTPAGSTGSGPSTPPGGNQGDGGPSGES
jgi:hypothetical protein